MFNSPKIESRRFAMPPDILANAAPEDGRTPEAACERCGSFDMMEIAGQTLCMDCIALAGCGCAGHDTENGG
jgi:hypothetical protein